MLMNARRDACPYSSLWPSEAVPFTVQYKMFCPLRTTSLQTEGSTSVQWGNRAWNKTLCQRWQHRL